MNPFRVNISFICFPRVLAALEPWAEASERLRRLCPGLALTNGFGVITWAGVSERLRRYDWAGVSERLRRYDWAEASERLRRYNLGWG